MLHFEEKFSWVNKILIWANQIHCCVQEMYCLQLSIYTWIWTRRDPLSLSCWYLLLLRSLLPAPPLLYNTQCHSRFNSLEERSGANSRSKGGGQLGSSPYGRDRTQVIFLHETCQKGLDIQIPSSAHIRIAGEEVQLPWYQALLMLKGLRKMRIKKADMQLRKERVSE